MGQETDLGSQEKSSLPLSTKATLTLLKLSHPFQNRTLLLEGRIPVKIGRSSLHALSTANNALFDCVVISRDHARLWYENGKFYLQDSKSSNGTFVNNELIGEKNKESPPTAVYSGDVVQFGSAVFSPDMKTRLGAIIALLRLYLPDGSEYLARPPNEAMSSFPTVQLQLLACYLREADHREETLRKKLSMLEQLVGCTSKAASEGWRAQVMEDQLLTKVASLQEQLEILSAKDLPEERLRCEIAKLTASNYQMNEISKQRIEKALKEKNVAMQKTDELTRSQENLLEECEFYKTMAEQNQEDLKDLGQKYSLYFEKYISLSQTVEIDKELHDKCKILEQENKRLAKYADKVVKEKEAMEKCLKSLQKDRVLAQSSQSEFLVSTAKKDIPESDIVLKHKFSVTLVSPAEEATNERDKTQSSGTSLDDSPTREGHSQMEQMFQRLERIEQVENIKVEKLKNIKRRLENLNDQYKATEQPNFSPAIKECLDEIGAELSIFLAESNNINYTDGVLAESTKNFNDIINNLKSDNTRLTSQITEMVENFKYLEAKKDLYQANLKMLTLKSVENAHEIVNLRKKLMEAQTGLTSRSNTIIELQNKMLCLEKSFEEESQVINNLRANLSEEQTKRNEVQRVCESQMEELKEALDALKVKHSECDRLKLSLLQLNEKAVMPDECGVSGAGPSVALTETLFEQKCVIEQMQANLAGVERERTMFGDLVKELAESKQAFALKHEESAELLKKVERLEANVDPVVAYFFPVIFALMFFFAVILFANRRPVPSVKEDVKLPE